MSVALTHSALQILVAAKPWESRYLLGEALDQESKQRGELAARDLFEEILEGLSPESRFDLREFFRYLQMPQEGPGALGWEAFYPRAFFTEVQAADLSVCLRHRMILETSQKVTVYRFSPLFATCLTLPGARG